MALPAPGQYNYQVEGGDCLPLDVTIKAAGVPFDLEGWSSEIVITWRNQALVLSSGSELEMSEAGESPQTIPDGRITGELSGSQTSALPYGRITKYEWSIRSAGGCKFTFMKGYIIRT